MPEIGSISIYECARVHIQSNVDGLIEIHIYDKDSVKIGGGNFNIGLYGPDNRIPDVEIHLQEHAGDPEFTYKFHQRVMSDEEFARADEAEQRKRDAREGFE